MLSGPVLLRIRGHPRRFFFFCPRLNEEGVGKMEATHQQTVFVQVRMPPCLYAQLRQLADRENYAVSAVVRRMVSAAVTREQRQEENAP